MSSHNDVIDYFAKKAPEYDLVDEQLYWVLSDHLAKRVLSDLIDKIQGSDIKLLDAWAWTGRWSLNFYELCNGKINLQADLIDITKEMLEVAEHKIDSKWLTKSFTYREWNIENLTNYSDNFYDFAISFYNVIGFVKDYEKAIWEVYKKLVDWWKYIGIVWNKHHGRYFSLLTNRLSELENLSNNKIRFNDLMPAMDCFDPGELRQVFKQAWFKNVKVYWLMNYIYPWMEETFLKWQSQDKSNLLKDQDAFNQILKLEYDNFYNEDLACRGNTLMFIATK